MTQVFLKLSPDYIKEPHPIDIVNVEAMMLWPDDARQRARYMALAGLEIMRTRPGEIFSHEDLLKAIDVAILAPAREDIKAVWDKRNFQGMVAGLVLYRAVEFSQLNKKPVPLGKIYELVVNGFKTERFKPLRIRLEAQTIKNDIWPRFRSVAHLWAASCFYIFPDKLEEQEHSLDLGRPFVCPQSELGRFLGISDSFWKEGKTLKADRASGPMLKEGESVRTQAGFEPPEIKVGFLPKSSN